ncbi:MAG: PAS domain S-box protein [Vulcanibacillus sp.]
MINFCYNCRYKIMIIFLLVSFSLGYFAYVNYSAYIKYIEKSEQNMAEILINRYSFVEEALDSSPLLIFLDNESDFNNIHYSNELSSLLLNYFAYGFNKNSIGIYSLDRRESVFHLGSQEFYSEFNQSIIDKINSERVTESKFFKTNSSLLYLVPFYSDNDIRGYIYTYKSKDNLLTDIQPYAVTYMVPICLILFILLFYKGYTNNKILILANNVKNLRKNNEFLAIRDDSFNEIAKSINDLKEHYSNEQEILCKILDGLPLGIIFYDNNGEIAYINNKVVQITGFSKKEINVFANKHNLLEGDDSVFWKTLCSGQKFFGFESYCPTKDGKEIPVMTSTQAIYDNFNNNLGIISSFINISEQDRLKKVEQNAKIILDHINDGIIRIDNEGIINGYNVGAEIMTGLKENEVMGKKYDDVFIKTRSMFTKLTLTLKKEKEYNYKKEIIAENGKKKHMMITTKILRDEDDKKIGAIGIYRDITEIEELTYRVQCADKLAVVGELAAGTAHEIRNPLTSIKGFIQLLEEKVMDKEKTLYIKLILEEIAHINDIITEMLMLAKPSKPSRSLTSINKTVKETVLFMNSESLLNNVAIITNLQDDLQSIEIDIRQIKQVFINVLTNALQAMKKGGEVKVSSKMNDERQMIEVIFEDTGEGIQEEILQRIYEPFFTTKEKGTGLGIPVSYQIMKNHGGDMEIRSFSGKGTEVILYFPLNLDLLSEVG